MRACVGERVMADCMRAWDEAEQLFAPDVSVEGRRKIVGFPPPDIHLANG